MNSSAVDRLSKAVGYFAKYLRTREEPSDNVAWQNERDVMTALDTCLSVAIWMLPESASSAKLLAEIYSSTHPEAEDSEFIWSLCAQKSAGLHGKIVNNLEIAEAAFTRICEMRRPPADLVRAISGHREIRCLGENRAILINLLDGHVSPPV
jgi:hypothetical protein